MEAKADDIFYQRLSPRTFTDQEVTEQDLLKLLEAARWAASCFNDQPWRFIYARKNDPDAKDRYEKLFDCLMEGNQKWAKDAPVLMLTVAKTTFERNGKPNRHALHDVGLAMGNFSIQAAKMNIMIHQMAGFSQEAATKAFDLAEDYEPVAMVAIGYSDEEKPDRSRKSLDELILNP